MKKAIDTIPPPLYLVPRMANTNAKTNGQGDSALQDFLHNVSIANAHCTYGHPFCSDRQWGRCSDELLSRLDRDNDGEPIGPRKVYLAYVCGAASLRDAESDEIVHRFKGHRSYEQHLPYAQIIARGNGWQLI